MAAASRLYVVLSLDPADLPVETSPQWVAIITFLLSLMMHR